MNRRGFLKMSLAAGVMAAIPVTLHQALKTGLPVIVGDGIHDDTEGLQAAINGREFVCDSGLVRVENGCMISVGGRYLISKTLVITDVPNIQSRTIRDAHFILGQPIDDPAFMFQQVWMNP